MRSPHARPVHVLGTLAAALATSCGAAQTSPAPTPPAACTVGDLADVLVADPAAFAHRDAVLAVTYRCGTLRVVDACHPPGRYRFATVPRADEHVRLDTAQEVAANLPGVSGDHAERAFVTTGRWSALARRLDRGDLTGACDNATHFVAAIDVDPASTAMRVHLVGIGSDGGELAFLAPTAPCAAGLVWRDGKCAAAVHDHAHRCRIGEAADCTAQCDRGDAASCTTLAIMYGAGLGVGKDETRAVALIQTACSRGDQLGCRHDADLLESGEAVAKDAARAATMLSAACDAGVASACTYDGAMTAQGEGVPADPVRAATLDRRGCDLGDRRGCALAGAGLLAADGDLGDAASLFADACAAADPDACNGLGGVLLMTGSGATDIARARGLFEGACKDGHDDACSNLAVALLAGSGDDRDEPRATQLLRDACGRHHEPACQLLAVHELETATTSEQFNRGLLNAQAACASKNASSCLVLARIRKQFAAACDRGEVLACANAGQMYAVGFGGAVDDADARDMLRRACDGKVEAACGGLGVSLVAGGGAADIAAGLALLRAGCRDRKVYACSPLGRSEAVGVGGKPDEPAALVTFQRGCAGGDVDSCEDGGTLAIKTSRDVAVALLARGCELGRATSCSKQGALVFAADRAHGVQLLHQGCDGGDTWACQQLAGVK